MWTIHSIRRSRATSTRAGGEHRAGWAGGAVGKRLTCYVVPSDVLCGLSQRKPQYCSTTRQRRNLAEVPRRLKLGATGLEYAPALADALDRGGGGWCGAPCGNAACQPSAISKARPGGLGGGGGGGGLGDGLLCDGHGLLFCYHGESCDAFAHRCLYFGAKKMRKRVDAVGSGRTYRKHMTFMNIFWRSTRVRKLTIRV